MPDLSKGTNWPFEVIGVAFALVGVGFIIYGYVRQKQVEEALIRVDYAPLKNRAALVFASVGVLARSRDDGAASRSSDLARRRERRFRSQTARLLFGAVEGSILVLLEQHGSLGYEQIAAHLRRPPDAVRTALVGLHDRGLIDVLSVGELEGQPRSAASYWRLSDAGRAELARLRNF